MSSTYLSLHAYLGGAAKTLDVVPEAIGGVADHVHLLLGLRATHCLADVMRDLKRTSSAWMHLVTQPRLGVGNQLFTMCGFWRSHGSVSLHHKFFWTSGND